MEQTIDIRNYKHMFFYGTIKSILKDTSKKESASRMILIEPNIPFKMYGRLTASTEKPKILLSYEKQMVCEQLFDQDLKIDKIDKGCSYIFFVCVQREGMRFEVPKIIDITACKNPSIPETNKSEDEDDEDSEDEE